MLYQAFFFLFFDISKNEEGLEFAFLDSLNLYKKEGKGSSFTCILHHGNKFCFLEQSTSFESINSWVLVFWPYPDSEFLTPPVGLFSNYMGNLSMSPTLYICFVGPFCIKSCLSHFCVVLTIQGLKLCWPFCSCLDLLCRPFLGISSLHHVFGGPCSEIQYQFQIQLVFDLPLVGWWRMP